MKTIEEWLAEYSVSHQNPTNKLVHWICVPIIFFTVVGLLYSIPNPFVEVTPDNSVWAQGIFAKVALILVTTYYAVLSPKLAVGMLIYVLLCLFICQSIQSVGLNLAVVSIVLFVLAWIGQFWGHSVEGKKPSFLKDLQFLMIGPAWIMSALYKKFGISL